MRSTWELLGICSSLLPSLLFCIIFTGVTSCLLHIPAASYIWPTGEDGEESTTKPGVVTRSSTTTRTTTTTTRRTTTSRSTTTPRRTTTTTLSTSRPSTTRRPTEVNPPTDQPDQSTAPTDNTGRYSNACCSKMSTQTLKMYLKTHFEQYLDNVS